MADHRQVRPCKHCPFRTDVHGFLRRERAEEIAIGLEGGAEFHCHKTVTHDDEDGEQVVTGDELVCAGSMIVLEKMDMPSQMMRIAERLGLYDRRLLDMDSPVFDSLDEFVDHHDA